MRLLIVSQYFWPEGFRINDLVGELVSRGHEVTVLTGVPNYPDGQVFPAFMQEPEKFASYEGAPVVRIPMLARGKGAPRLMLNYFSFMLSGLTFGAWRLRGKRYDAILMFATSPITSAIPAVLLRRLKRAPLLLWVLDLWPETLSAVGVVRAPWLLKCVGKVVSFIYRHCDLILAQSRAFFGNIENWSGDQSRIRYLPGWAEPIFDTDLVRIECASEVSAFKDTFNVMFAGNIGDAQDFPSILAAADILRDRNDIRWLIVGDGRAADEVRREIARLELQDRVVMLGRHPVEKMPGFFRVASALLVSLKAEPIFSMTIPGKVQSYLAAGVPILGMLDGEGARVIEESGAGYSCNAGDAQMLAKCVDRLAAIDPAQRNEMGRRGRAYCKQEFDRGTLISRLENWLAETPYRTLDHQAKPS
ncbi:MAG: glycosyltransferase family 4 protein [Rhizobacter sp.]|nr:glycosyltransferase family 4 protein [Rhizobacter sp.]